MKIGRWIHCAPFFVVAEVPGIPSLPDSERSIDFFDYPGRTDWAQRRGAKMLECLPVPVNISPALQVEGACHILDIDYWRLTRIRKFQECKGVVETWVGACFVRNNLHSNVRHARTFDYFCELLMHDRRTSNLPM